MADTITYRPSPSGYWQIEISRVWEDQNFFYKPGNLIVVDEETLKRAIADGVVTNVAPY